MGLKPDERIGLLLENSFESYVYVYASLALGLTYVPLSPTEPAKRLNDQLKTAGVKVLIGRSFDAALDVGSFKLIDLSKKVQALTSAGLPPIFQTGSEDPILYLLFTSGTTGRPKGILISESNVHHFCNWALKKFEIDSKDVVLAHVNLTFDLSVFHLFVPFLAGATVRITPPNLEKIAPGGQFKQGVTIALLVPRMTGLLASAGFLTPGAFPALRHILFCGERLMAQQVSAWQKTQPALQVHNLYGPTEATVACSCYSFQAGESPRDPVSIGTPIGETTFSLRDGELVISGPQVMKYEYLIDSPVAKRRVGTSYASGDVVEVDSSGHYTWITRRDDQIKIQGHRVELAEVESKLSTNGQISEVACVLDRSTERLVLFFTLRSSATEERALQEFQEISRRELPFYMHPSLYKRVESIPLTKNGKTDHKELLKSLASSASEAR